MQAITQTFANWISEELTLATGQKDKEHFLQAFGQRMLATMAGNEAQPTETVAPPAAPPQAAESPPQATPGAPPGGAPAPAGTAPLAADGDGRLPQRTP